MVHLLNTGYEVMLCGFSSALAAQSLKYVWYFSHKKPVNFRLFVQTGGMPSSHSASMTALATSVGIITGFDSVIFSVAVGLALIVMYDAAGVRRAAGRMAGILNKLTDDLYHQHPDHVPERLRELLGHTPIEVLVGALLGVLTAYLVHYDILP